MQCLQTGWLSAWSFPLFLCYNYVIGHYQFSATPHLLCVFQLKHRTLPTSSHVWRAPDEILASIDVEIEILLADRFIGAVFTNLLDRGVELLAQIIITLAKGNRDLRFGTGNITKELAAICALLL